MYKLKNKLDKEEGFAVVLALMIIMILSVLGLSLMTIAAYQYMDSDRTKPANRAFDLADCGLSWSKAYIAQDNDFPPSGIYDPDPKELSPGISNSKFDVVITKTSAYRYTIVSKGIYEDTKNSKTYNRTLEEVVEWRGAKGHFEAFTYTLFSRDGNVTLDTGKMGIFTGSGMIVQGGGENAIYAGNDVTLEDTKNLFAGGTLAVNGDIDAGNNVSVKSRSGIFAAASLIVSGNITAGGSVTVSSSSGCLANSKTLVTGSINAGLDVNLSSSATFICRASTKVAQNINTSVNVKRNVNITADAVLFAGSESYVGMSGVPSSVNAVGTSNMSTSGIGSAKAAKVYGNLKNNGDADLSGSVRVDGVWQHGVACSPVPSSDKYGSHSHSNPGILATDIPTVLDVEFPEPDWGWYKTVAIAQGNYKVGNYTVASTLDAGVDSSMWVLYVTGNVSIYNLNFNVAKKGVIVCEGDVNITHQVQFNGVLNSKTTYQVIAKGNITHGSFWTLNRNAEDSVFLYTNGTYDSNNNGIEDDGNVRYDLGYFRDMKGQVTCKGNITAPMSSFGSMEQHKITYASPLVSGGAWPIPFESISFREL